MGRVWGIFVVIHELYTHVLFGFFISGVFCHGKNIAIHRAKRCVFAQNPQDFLVTIKSGMPIKRRVQFKDLRLVLNVSLVLGLSEKPRRVRDNLNMINFVSLIQPQGMLLAHCNPGLDINFLLREIDF